MRIAVALLASALAVSAQPVSIRFEAGVFRVIGLSGPVENPPAVFAVYAGAGDVPPLLGSYSFESGELLFRPRFPLSPGIHARAVFRAPGRPPSEAVFEIPGIAPAPATTRVAQVYPSTNVLPENQLKFYVYFSAPMQKGLAWRKIHLLDARGAPVTLPFLELDEELWDRDGARLTVLFDPGRIKRGVRPLTEMGPAMEAGRAYTLLIDRDWPDGRGAPLAAAFRKQFRVGPPDRSPPDPAAWRVSAPRTGSSDPLVLDFPKPLDYALLQHLLEVVGPTGTVSGTVAVERDETQWRFTPREAWKAGTHHIIVQTALEDLAGNHIGRPFDIDTFEPVTRSIPRETVSLTFDPRP